MGEATEGGSRRGSGTLGLALGLGVIYLVWGSTYLAIGVAVKTMPPFLMGGSRFAIAGAIMFVVAKLGGAPTPSRIQWHMAIIVGCLLILGGNGLVVWAQQFIPSNLTALLITMTPLWIALFDWLRPGGTRPPRAVWAGSLLGFAGMIALFIWAKGIDGQAIRPLAVLAMLIASVSWAFGSVFAKYAPRPESPVMTSAMHMLCGGTALLALSGIAGEWTSFEVSKVSRVSFLGYLYLIVVGSLLAMTVYAYLLHVAEPNLIATYAFVNPIIAVILGWLILGETLSGPTMIAGAIIVVAVAWLIGVQWRYARRPAPTLRRQRKVSKAREVTA